MHYGDYGQDYFNWLCDTVHADVGVTSYWLLMGKLHHTTFTWSRRTKRDENRAMDGKSLREVWGYENNIPNAELVLSGPCSVLEMLVGLAGRMDFELAKTEGDRSRTAEFFWDMISNLGLMKFSDDVYYDEGGNDEVRDILTRWMERRYDFYGHGGIFPLAYAEKDQRNEEIWYQMQTYLNENYEMEE